MKKRILSVLLVLCMVLALSTGIRASAADRPTNSHLQRLKNLEELPTSDKLSVEAVHLADVSPDVLPVATRANSYYANYLININTIGQNVLIGSTFPLRAVAAVNYTYVERWHAAVFDPSDELLYISDGKTFNDTGFWDLTLDWNTTGNKAGTYTICFFSSDSSGNIVESTFVEEQFVEVKSSVALKSIAWHDTTTHLCIALGGDDLGTWVDCTPSNTTVDRDPVFYSYDTNVCEVSNLAGFPWVYGTGYGQATLKATVGSQNAYNLVVEVCTDYNGHNLVSGVYQQPTCTSPGFSGSHCTKCGWVKGTPTTVPATGHKIVTTTTKAPTCEETGVATQICSVCGYNKGNKTLAALGHNWQPGAIVVPEDGDDWGTRSCYCSRCGAQSEQPYHTCPSDQFTDRVSDKNWAHKGIDFCVRHGLMNGTGNGLFSPNKTLTRAELVNILWRQAGSPVVDTTTPFTDLSKDWYKPAVNWAVANGVINGVTETTFAPNTEVTREMFATILYRYCSEYLHIDVSAREDLSSYPDVNKVHSYAKDALSWAVAAGLITGTSSNGTVFLSPTTTATRAQTASILMRFVTML